MYESLTKTDPKIAELIEKEANRQREQLQMIPSENYASKSVHEAVGSVLMNKYSEGQVNARYYQGNQIIDQIEATTKERALAAFGLNPDLWAVNVQPYSGTPANLAVFTALLEPGDTIMPMYLPDGGHLSHGWIYKGNHLTLTSKVWNIEFYHVDEATNVFDYDKVREQALAVKPKLLISGGTAYPRDIDYKRMGEIAKEVGAKYLADVSHEAGLIAAGVLNSPFDHADVVTMTTHKTLRGPRGAMIFAQNNLINEINRAVFPGLQGGPHNHTIAGIGVALNETMTDSFKAYARQVVKNAQTLAKVFTDKGYAVVSGGTDKHLVLLDLRNKNLSGKIPALALEYANIIMNFNTIPNDSAPPMYPSGLRMGTPALTSRGMKEPEMEKIAYWIDEVITLTSAHNLPEDTKLRKDYIESLHPIFAANEELKRLAKSVKEFALNFPVPGLDDHE